MKTIQMNKMKDYSEFANSKDISHCHFYFDRDSQASRGEGKLHSEKKGRLHGCSDLRLFIWGSGRKTNSRASSLFHPSQIFK